VRDSYDAPDESEPLRKFLAGEPDDLQWFEGWLGMIRAATAKGRRFTRVRVVTAPLTDYSRFGVWCSQFTNGAGEDIRYLKRDKADAEGLPDYDYWLFDSRKLVRMNFDDNDAFLGADVIEDHAVVAQHNFWRDTAWRYAIERDDFADEQGIGRIERP